MYEGYYGLREKPFNLTPDPKYLYLSEKHKEAFAHLLFGIKNRSGFVMVTGEIGTGKTTISRTLLGQLDDDTEVAFIFNPCLSPEELLRTINEDFGIRTVATTVRGLIDELNEYLLDRNARGKNCVLVIDEAQNLTPTVLEQIRLLSNLETETQKLLQIVLLGQPELMQMLSLHELRQLNQRITARYHLQPLSRDETYQYVAYRMRVAGARRRIYFTAPALKRVYALSGGTPRVINAICDRALLIGYTRELRDITPAIVNQAAREVRGEQPKRKIWPRIRAWMPNPAVVTAGAAVLLLALFMRDRLAYAPVTPPTSNEAVQGPSAAPPAPSSSLAFAAPVPIEKPVQVDPPPTPAEADPSFMSMVDRQDPAASRNAAVQGVLRAWNLALLTNLPADDSVRALTAFAEENRLTAEVLTLTLEQIEAINLPALIKLHGRTRSIWSAVVGAEGDELRITVPGSEPMLFPRDRINESYLNEAIVLWRDQAPDMATLRLGIQGEDVRVLQVQLRALGRLDRAPTGQYDEATAEAIRSIQRETGLKVDGAAGRHTRMVLSSWLPGFNTPGLRALPSVLMNDAASAAAVKPAPPAAEAASKSARAFSTSTKKDVRPQAKQAKTEPVKMGPPLPESEPAAPASPPLPQNVDASPSQSDQAEQATVGSLVPQVRAEDLPKPGETPPAPAPAPSAAENAPAAGAATRTEDTSVPAWTGGLPLVPIDADEMGSTS